MAAKATCTRCGTLLPVSLRFCDVCGEELSRPAPLPPRASPEQEKLRRACGFWVEVFRTLPHSGAIPTHRRAFAMLAASLHMNDKRKAQVNAWIAQAIDRPVALFLAAEAVSSTLDHSERKVLFKQVCQHCWDDDARLSVAEIVAVRTVARAFGLSEGTQCETLINRFGPLAVCEYILGVSRNAPLAEIRLAYDRACERVLKPEGVAVADPLRAPDRLKRLQVAFDELAAAKLESRS